MPEYLSPGVYIEEFEIGARPIEGVSTSTAGFLGEAERGPTVPQLVTSWLQYQRVFGSYFGPDKYLPYAVQGFFQNGGQRCYIVRIVKAGTVPATTAELKLIKETENALTIEAIGEGSWGNRIAVKVYPGSDRGFKLRVFYWKTEPSELYDPTTDLKTLHRPAQNEDFDNLMVDDTSPDYYEKRVNEISNLIRIKLKGDDTGVEPEAGHDGRAQGGSDNTIILASDASDTENAYNDMLIEITDGTGKDQVRTITEYAGDTKTATVDEDWETDNIPDSTSKYSFYWPIRTLKGGADSVEHSGTALEGSDNTITLDSEASDTVDVYNDMLIEITDGTGQGQIRKITDYAGSTRIATVESNWDTNPASDSDYRVINLKPDIVPNDYLRTDTSEPGKRKGLTGLEEIDGISIVYAPNSLNVKGLTESLVPHCEKFNRFAVIDSEKGSDTVSEIKPRNDYNTQFAAFYYPWIKIIHPESGAFHPIPPGGYVAGIYARSDTERGVHKAPANEAVRGAKEPEFLITKGEQDILNPRGVNVIRAFPGRGIMVWGARTLSDNSLWKYINVRRLFIYVEESIERGTQWVVFEPNDEKLWARVRATITQFLTGVWRSGALMGTKAEEAFFVKCDRSTMTQDDIDNGRLICVIGIAPVKPAEFVIFRIAQWQGGSSATE